MDLLFEKMVKQSLESQLHHRFVSYKLLLVRKKSYFESDNGWNNRTNRKFKTQRFNLFKKNQ